MTQLDIIIKKYDKMLLWIILALCGIGVVMLYSASSFKSLYMTSGLSDTIYLRSHLKRMIIGITAMFFFAVLDYRKLKSIAPHFIVLSIFLLFLTLGSGLVLSLVSFRHLSQNTKFVPIA